VVEGGRAVAADLVRPARVELVHPKRNRRAKGVPGPIPAAFSPSGTAACSHSGCWLVAHVGNLVCFRTDESPPIWGSVPPSAADLLAVSLDLHAPNLSACHADDLMWPRHALCPYSKPTRVTSRRRSPGWDGYTLERDRQRDAEFPNRS